MSILIQAGISGVILVFSQINATVVEAYQFLVDMAVILYFIPFLYMYAAAIKLSYRKDRANSGQAVLVPGGRIRHMAYRNAWFRDYSRIDGVGSDSSGRGTQQGSF